MVLNLTITTENDALVCVTVDEGTSIEVLKAMLEAETGIASSSMQLLHNARLLDDLGAWTVSAAGLHDGDLLVAMRKEAPSASARGDPNAMLADGSAADPRALQARLPTLRGAHPLLSAAHERAPPKSASAPKNIGSPRR